MPWPIRIQSVHTSLVVWAVLEILASLHWLGSEKKELGNRQTGRSLQTNLRYLFSSSSPIIFFSSKTSLSAKVSSWFGISPKQGLTLTRSKLAKSILACCAVKCVSDMFPTCGRLLIVKGINRGSLFLLRVHLSRTGFGAAGLLHWTNNFLRNGRQHLLTTISKLCCDDLCEVFGGVELGRRDCKG